MKKIKNRKKKKEIGNWILDIGNRKSEIGNWKLEIGNRKSRMVKLGGSRSLFFFISLSFRQI